MPEAGSSCLPCPSTPAAAVHTPWGEITAAVTPGMSSLSTQRWTSASIFVLRSAGSAAVGASGHGSTAADGEPEGAVVGVLPVLLAGSAAGVEPVQPANVIPTRRTRPTRVADTMAAP